LVLEVWKFEWNGGIKIFFLKTDSHTLQGFANVLIKL